MLAPALVEPNAAAEGTLGRSGGSCGASTAGVSVAWLVSTTRVLDAGTTTDAFALTGRGDATATRAVRSVLGCGLTARAGAREAGAASS